MAISAVFIGIGLWMFCMGLMIITRQDKPTGLADLVYRIFEFLVISPVVMLGSALWILDGIERYIQYLASK